MSGKAKRPKIVLDVEFVPRSGKPKRLKVPVDAEGVGRIQNVPYAFPRGCTWPGDKDLPRAVVFEEHGQALIPTEEDELGPAQINEMVGSNYVREVVDAQRRASRSQLTAWLPYAIMGLGFLVLGFMLNGVAGDVGDIRQFLMPAPSGGATGG